MRVLFIGSNPSQKSSSIVPFWHDTKSRKVLDNWLSQVVSKEMPAIDWLCENVSPNPTPLNRPLKMSEIKASLDGLAYRIYGFNGANPDKVVALGKTAEKALKMLGIDHYVMPHPSGLNRQLNDPKFVEEKIKGLREYLSPVKSS